jgi:hypothetical protein
MIWRVVGKADSRAVSLADRYYTRQKPGTPQFTRPGRNLVLLSEDEKAVWTTWMPAKGERMDGLDVWECTMFRNEGPYLSSHLIVLALAVTRAEWGEPPADGMITYIGKHLHGGCFHAAGFRNDGYSKSRGLLRLRLSGDRFPPAMAAAATMQQMSMII